MTDKKDKLNSDVNEKTVDNQVIEEDKLDLKNFSSDEIKKLKEDIDLLEQEKKLMQKDYLLVLADKENMKKLYKKELEDVRKYHMIEFAKIIVDIMDSLSLVNKNASKKDISVKEIIEPINMVQKDVSKMLKKFDITEISPKGGDKFDYSIHHAISKKDSKEYPKDSILEVIQLGYMIQDRLVRPALVSVVSE